MIIGVPKETYPGEHRVALIPASIPSLQKAEIEVVVEGNAGAEAGYPDSVFTEKGGKIASSRAQVFESADIVVQLRLLGANPDQGQADLSLLRQGQILVGMAEALSSPDSVKELAGKGVTTFAMELIPRITRAQSMDVLSSMGTVAGYKAVLLAADSFAQDVSYVDDGCWNRRSCQGSDHWSWRGRITSHFHGTPTGSCSRSL